MSSVVQMQEPPKPDFDIQRSAQGLADRFLRPRFIAFCVVASTLFVILGFWALSVEFMGGDRA